MADQQYIYITTPAAAVVAPASYGYTGYTQQPEGTYVQPSYTPAPVTAYSYDQAQFAAAAPHGSYAQPDYSQASYTSPSQSTYSQPAAYGATVTTYVSGTPYSMVSSGAYANPSDQPPAYGQQPYAQPVVAYGQPVAQPPTAYSQPPTQQAVIYGQLPSQAPVPIGQPGAQPPSAYVQPGQQTPVYGQPPIQQPPTAYGQPAVQQTFAYAGQPPTTPQPSSYATPLVQTTPLGQPPSAQHPPGYGQPPSAQQPPPAYGQPTSQQPPPYGQPSATQPTIYGQPPAQPPLGFNQAPGYIPPSPVPLVQPPVFIATPSGPPGASQVPSIQTLAAPGIGPLSGGVSNSNVYGRGRGGPGGGAGGPNRGFGIDRGAGGDRTGNSNVVQTGEIEVQQFPDTIFIQNLADDVSEEALAQHFGAIGKLKTDNKTGKPRVWLVRDKITGRPRGEATIGYEDIGSVARAIELFNNKDFQGRKIRVQVASRKIPAGTLPHTPSLGSERGGMGGRGRGGGGGGPGSGSDGGQPDWICRNPDCGNQNFGWRQECNRCKAPKDAMPPGIENGQDDGGPPGMRGGFRGMGGGPRGRGGNRGSLTLADGDHGNLGNAIRGGFRGGLMMNAMGGPMAFRGRGGPMRGRDRMDRRGRPY